MEFTISDVMKVPMEFDDKDFFEFMWLYNRVIKKVQTIQPKGTDITELMGMHNG